MLTAHECVLMCAGIHNDMCADTHTHHLCFDCRCSAMSAGSGYASTSFRHTNVTTLQTNLQTCNKFVFKHTKLRTKSRAVWVCAQSGVGACRRGGVGACALALMWVCLDLLFVQPYVCLSAAPNRSRVQTHVQRHVYIHAHRPFRGMCMNMCTNMRVT